MESPVSVWEDQQCPFRVEWTLEKLNQLRIAVMDAFYALPRGGIEIGGVLLGRVEGKVMQIDSFVAMECEHLTGPSFVLSPKDESALESQLAALEGRVVGWFHSHTRSELQFSAQDTEIHNRFFPKSSQIAMVVRPANSQPPCANYFFRGPRGQMVGGTTTFVVEPITSKRSVAPLPVALLPPAPPPKPKPIAVPVALAVPARPVPLAAPPTPPVIAPPVIPEPLVEVAAPAFLREQEPAPGRSIWWPIAGLMIGIVLCAALFLTRELWMPK